MPATPLFSIVIATKNRIPYAMDVIRTILKLPDSDLELIIQDNSDTTELKTYVETQVADSRLRYNYTPPPFSPIDNFNSAIAMATGEYVCLIGDDDGVNPEIMTAVRWAKKNGLDALTPKVCATYLWPGVTLSSITGVVAPGTMTVNSFSGILRFPNVSAKLRCLMQNGAQEYLKTDLPRIYHGIVKRDCMEQVNRFTGHYFGGLSPDIYAVVALSTIIHRTAAIDYPLTIAGVCPASASAGSSTGVHVGNLVDAPHFRDRPPYEWSDLVPRFNSVWTIWADAAIAAARDLGRDDLIDNFNIEMLAAYCVCAHPGYRHIVFRDMYSALRRRGTGPVLGTIRFLRSVLLGPGCHFCSRVAHRLIARMRCIKPHRVTGVPSISVAIEQLVAMLTHRGCSFDMCVSRNVRQTDLALQSRSEIPACHRKVA